MGSGIVSGAKLIAAGKSYRALFMKYLEGDASAALALVSLLSMEVQSKGKEEVLNWLGDVPGMQEWTGDRVLQRLRDTDFAIRNKKWANGIVVDVDDIEDDNLGVVKPRILMLADKAGLHMRNLLIDLIKNGATGLCYDGKYFFAADHEENKSGVQSNKHNLALSAANFRTVYAGMLELKNDQGENMGVTPTHLWCNTTLQSTAEEICFAERDSNGKTNVDKGKVKPLVFPSLGSTTMWGLADLSKPYKPLIKQMRRKVRFRAQDNPEADSVFMRDEARFGADYRGNAGYGLWQLMALGKA